VSLLNRIHNGTSLNHSTQSKWVFHRIVRSWPCAIVKVGERTASASMVPPPTPNTPCSQLAEADRTSRTGGYPVLHATRCPKQDKRSVLRDSEFTPHEIRKTIAPLFGHWVVMLAIHYRRAPIPVSPKLWKTILRRGFPSNLDELAKLARRYLLIGDPRMLLAELRTWPRIPAQTLGVVEVPEAGLRGGQGAYRAESNADSTRQTRQRPA
jgi:hypothetical protein